MTLTATSGNCRETFTISRRLEFFSESELEKQISYLRSNWPTVIVAELVDNALDRCEEIGRLPEISVTVTEGAR